MSTAGYLQDAKNQQKRLAETITAKGITATATEKYKDLVDKVAQIENLKGEERTLENFTNVLSEPKSIVQLEYPEPKNLFSLANRTWANFGDTSNTTVRNINKDNFYFQVSSNNYVNNSKTGYEIVNGNTIKITRVQHAYGLGVPFHLIAGQQYTISCIRDNEKSRIRVSYYDVNGNYLSDFSDLPGSFTVPENAYWTMIIFIAYHPVGGAGELTFSNIQLELGTTATPYEPYPAPKTLNAKLGSKNLFDETTLLSKDHTEDEEAYIFENGKIGLANLLPNTTFKYKTQYTLQYTAKQENPASSTTMGYPRFAVVYTDGTKSLRQITTEYTTITITSTFDKTVSAIKFEYSNVGKFYLKKDSLSLVEGTVALSPYSPYISDLTTVNVTRCGKNMFDKSTLIAGSSVVKLTQTTNGFTFKTTATSKTMNVGSNIYLPAGTYYCSGTAACSDTSYKGGWAVYDNENKTFIINNADKGTIDNSFTITESKTYQVNFYAPYNAPVGVTMTFENIQLELDSIATNYEPYQGQTYTPTASGEVTGITNLYPVTTLLTNNAGVVFTRVLQGTQGSEFIEILPSSGKNGITKINQTIVDSTIDSNIKPENIKKGVSILGVTGDYICNYTYDETTKELVLIL